MVPTSTVKATDRIEKTHSSSVELAYPLEQTSHHVAKALKIATEDTTSLPWEVQRRPSFKAAVAIYAVGLALFIGGGIFGAMIHLEHKPWFGFGVGAIMAALLIAGVRKGTIVSVDEAGMLTLNYGAKDNLRFHLSLIEDSTMVKAGNLRGVGLRSAITPPSISSINPAIPSAAWKNCGVKWVWTW